jgi:hypothetical protein
MHILFLALALSVQQAPQASPAPMQATPEAPAATQARPPADDPDDRVVCRRERVLGSNRPQRICMTRQQWEAASDTSQEQLRKMRPGGEELPRSGM